ncbi:MAG: TIGR01777 family oxidoreductase [Armatimonadetes bacterium]|nr:TIGR01777 family oxidoreductase [Armatimonadota bacterium]MDW8122348.1 TIGR01777 family oxidoreductase [Armatimonadota bacterium]
MKVVLFGGTGFIGRNLVRHLINRYGADLQLTVVTRRKGAVGEIHPVARPFVWDASQQSPPVKVLNGCDVVINLAGEIVAQRWTRKVKELIRDSRVLTTRNIVESIGQASVKPRVLVNASATGYYGSRGDEELSEASGPGDDFLSRVCVGWEEEALRAREMGVRVVLARFGLVLGYDGGAMERILPFFEWGIGGILGNGRQWWSWIHIRDTVGAITHCIEDERISGAVNIVGPQPVRNRTFTKVLASVVGKPALFPVPAFALRLLYGEMSTILLSSQKVIPSVLKDTGFSYQHPDLSEALAHIRYWRRQWEQGKPLEDSISKGLPIMAQD